MKKRIQNYLSGNNEGFSLVELIIVIAIMAILIGVVALAVIPNLERSRESKDLSTLDSAASALSVAVANAGSAVKAPGTITISDGSATATGTGSDTVLKLLKEQIDVSTLKLASNACSGEDIVLNYDTTSGSEKVVAQAGEGNIKAKYAKDDAGAEATFKVVASEKKAD